MSTEAEINVAREAILQEQQKMSDVENEIQGVLDAYCKLTGREAKMQIYQHAIWDFCRAGFTQQDMITVLTFLLRENRRNSFQYSLKLGHLINDHMRFSDLLGEAKAKERNRIKPPTPKQAVIAQFRGSPEPTATGNAMTVKEILRKVIQ